MKHDINSQQYCFDIWKAKQVAADQKNHFVVLKRSETRPGMQCRWTEQPLLSFIKFDQIHGYRHLLKMARISILM